MQIHRALATAEKTPLLRHQIQREVSVALSDKTEKVSPSLGLSYTTLLTRHNSCLPRSCLCAAEC